MQYSIPTYNKFALLNDPSFDYLPPDPPDPPNIFIPDHPQACVALQDNLRQPKATSPADDLSPLDHLDTHENPSHPPLSSQIDLIQPNDTSTLSAYDPVVPAFVPVIHDTLLPVSSTPASNVRSHSDFKKSSPVTIQGFSDGGYLNSSDMSAGWWLYSNQSVVCAKGELITWSTASNNVAEYFGLIRCLEATLDLGYSRLIMNMDSLLVVQQVLGHWECKNPCLFDLLQYSRSLAEQLDFFTIQHTVREGNTVADALCNKAFEGYTGTHKNWLSTVDHPTAQYESDLGWSKWSTFDTSVNWSEWWSLVMEELKSYGPMIRNSQLINMPSFLDNTPSIKSTKKVTFAPLPITKPILMSKWPYVIEPPALVEMKLLAAEAKIPWNNDRYKILIPTLNTHGVNMYSYPHLDAQYTTSILAGINWDLPRLIRAWRGQSPSDSRPNKSLNFSRIEKGTMGYEKQEDLKELIEHGYGLHWDHPYVGVRPLPRNHLSADQNAEIMGATILKGYKQGRLMVVNAQEVADHVPAFATSPYGCVAKANKPLTETCRPIHNQSAPAGTSINESLDATLRPDATWPGASYIADRIIEATSLYGAGSLKAFVTDIADAFLNVGLLDTDVQVNGGILPLSNIATIATSCVFGNCESPGAFKLLNCVPHLHRQAGSIINGVNTPFDVRFYVDDGNAIEPDLGNRLELAETSLRSKIHDVFGPNSIQEDKTSQWSPLFTSLGYSWNLPEGTVSIPEMKLLRIKKELLRFSLLSSASITEFRSLVGKLRHVATCCKPAGSLMALLGNGLSAHKVSSGKQQRRITTAMRSELQWWAAFLTPERFHNLPVEWLGKRENIVSTWLHCYSKQDIGVWLCHHADNTSAFTPWDTSLLVTILTAIKNNLGSHPLPKRMSHTRIIMNDCKIACNINQGSSPEIAVQHLFKTVGAWQLDNRHRITATTPTWERSPSLTPISCLFHPNSNLLFQTLDQQNTEEFSPQRLSIGKPLLSPPARKALTADTSAIGSYSVQASTCLKSGSTSCHLTTKPWSWRGLQSIVGSSGTTKQRKEINMPPIKTRRRQLNGRIVTTATPSSIFRVQPLSSSKPPTVGIRTTLNRCNLALPVCCCAAMKNSSPPLTEPLHGVFSSFNTSFSAEAGSFGKPIMQDQGLPRPNAITESNGTTLPSKIAKEKLFTSLNQKRCTKFKSSLTMPKPTNKVVETSSHLDPLATPFYVRCVQPSSLLKHEAFGTRKSPPTPYPEASKHPPSLPFSRERLKPKVSTHPRSLDTRYGLAMPQHSSNLDTENWSSGLQVDGLVRPWPDIPASLVGCC